MPSVMGAPALVAYVETHDFAIEEAIERALPQPRRARPGFWRALAHAITKHLTHAPREGYPPSCSASRPFEAPIDRLVREYPYLSIYALALI